MLALLASLLLSSPIPTEEDLIALVQHYNQGCLSLAWCREKRGRYYTEEALRPPVQEVLRQARRLGIPALFLMAHVQAESEWVSDAISLYNGIRLHPTDPWNKPPPGRRTWWGLDLGLAQLHVPSRWSRKCTWAEVQQFRDPAQNIRIFGEWLELSLKTCRKMRYTRCRQMEAATGVAVYRKTRGLVPFFKKGLKFLRQRHAARLQVGS